MRHTIELAAVAAPIPAAKELRLAELGQTVRLHPAAVAEAHPSAAVDLALAARLLHCLLTAELRTDLVADARDTLLQRHHH